MRLLDRLKRLLTEDDRGEVAPRGYGSERWGQRYDAVPTARATADR